MHQKILRSNHPIDSIEAFSFAQQIHLDLVQFKTNYSNSELIEKINRSNKVIDNLGIYQTPTIIINGLIYSDEYNKESLEKYIRNILNYE